MPRSIPAVALALTACFGSPIEQQERSYRYKLESMDKLIARADGQTKAELLRNKGEMEKTYAALPSERDRRGEGLGKLNQQMSATLEEFGKRVEASEARAKKKAAEVANADRQRRIAEIAGTWKGGGIELEIGEGGRVRYESKKGVVEKAIQGAIRRIDDREFEVAALAFRTTFRMDVKPHPEGSTWKMTVDGTELTRIAPP